MLSDKETYNSRYSINFSLFTSHYAFQINILRDFLKYMNYKIYLRPLTFSAAPSSPTLMPSHIVITLSLFGLNALQPREGKLNT